MAVAAAVAAAPEVLAAVAPELGTMAEGLLGGGGGGGASALGNTSSLVNEIVDALAGVSNQKKEGDTEGQIQI